MILSFQDCLNWAIPLMLSLQESRDDVANERWVIQGSILYHYTLFLRDVHEMHHEKTVVHHEPCE